MTLDTLDYGASNGGSISTITLAALGIDNLNFSNVISDTGTIDQRVTHITAELADGRTIDLGTMDVSAARDVVKTAVFGTVEGFTQLFDVMEGVE